MGYCAQCGARIDSSARFCPSCGARVPAQGEAPVYNADKDKAENKVMAIFAYLFVLVLVPLFASKDSRFVRYHTNQGLVLALLYLGYSIVGNIFRGMIFFLPGVVIFSILYGLLWFIPLALSIIGIVNVTRGDMKPLPVIGKITILK